MPKTNNTISRGKFKELIHSELYKSKEIRDLILGDTEELSSKEIQNKFKEHVMSHLFIDDLITQTETYIYYDVYFPALHTQVKNCRVLMYLICHRDILDNYNVDGYYGNRTDVLSEMVENVLINNEEIIRSFGIGKLLLSSVEPYNSRNFYGCILTFDVSDFR